MTVMMIGTIGTIALALLLLASSSLVVKPIVSDIALDDMRSGVRNEVVEQLDQAVTGEIVIRDDDINQRLATSSNLDPIDDASVQISPDGLVVELHAYGLSGTYRSTVSARDGSIVLETGSIDGPLGLVIPNEEISSAVNSEIASALAESGYRVDAVTMTDGAMVLAVSG